MHSRHKRDHTHPTHTNTFRASHHAARCTCYNKKHTTPHENTWPTCSDDRANRNTTHLPSPRKKDKTPKPRQNEGGPRCGNGKRRKKTNETGAVPRPFEPCECTTSRAHIDPWPLLRHPENSDGLPGPYKLRGLPTLKKRQNHGKSDTHKRNTNTGNTTETRAIFFFSHILGGCRGLCGCSGVAVGDEQVSRKENQTTPPNFAR